MSEFGTCRFTLATDRRRRRTVAFLDEYNILYTLHTMQLQSCVRAFVTQAPAARSITYVVAPRIHARTDFIIAMHQPTSVTTERPRRRAGLSAPRGHIVPCGGGTVSARSTPVAVQSSLGAAATIAPGSTTDSASPSAVRMKHQ
jgi:hypothetical protein